MKKLRRGPQFAHLCTRAYVSFLNKYFTYSPLEVGRDVIFGHHLSKRQIIIVEQSFLLGGVNIFFAYNFFGPKKSCIYSIENPANINDQLYRPFFRSKKQCCEKLDEIGKVKRKEKSKKSKKRAKKEIFPKCTKKPDFYENRAIPRRPSPGKSGVSNSNVLRATDLRNYGSTGLCFEEHS